MIVLMDLQGGPGLHDPCEKEPTDVLSDMTADQAEALTCNAQVRRGFTCAVIWY